MKQGSSKLGNRWMSQKWLLVALGLLGLLVVLVGVGYWLVVPGMARSVMRSKLDQVEARLGLEIETGPIETAGLSGIEVRDVRVLESPGGPELFTAGTVGATLDPLEVIGGERALSSLHLRDIAVYVRKRADGTTNLEQILARRGGGEARTSGDGEADGDGRPGFLRYFGGEWPELVVERAALHLEADPGAAPWPVTRAEVDRLTMDASGDEAEVTGQVRLTRGEGYPRWRFPQTADVELNLALPLDESTGRIALAPALEVVDLPPFEHVRYGIGAVGIERGRRLVAEQMSVGVQGASEPTRLAELDRVMVEVNAFTTNPAELRILDVVIDGPKLLVSHDAQFGSGLSDLLHLTRAPLAGHVHGRAKSVVGDIAEKRGLAYEDDEGGGGLLARLGEVDWSDVLANRAPQHLVIKNAQVAMRDERPLDVIGQHRDLALRDGRLEFSHRPLNGELVAEGGFAAIVGDGEAAGTGAGKIRWNYRTGAISVDAEADKLDLTWLVQLVGGPLEGRVRGGILRGQLALSQPSRGERLDFEGLVGVQAASVYHPKLAELPLEGVTASYDFAGYFDPKQPLPEPQLIDPPKPPAQPEAAPANADGSDAHDPADEPQPPTRGAFVVEKGAAALNGVEATFRPALYGIDGSRRPNRLRVDIRLPTTPVQTLFEAVPDAIKGPLVGTKMKGKFGWEFAVEIPLYDADSMEWKNEPVVEEVEILELPEAADVRLLRGEFVHTIHDPKIEFERTVTIPAMRPTPVDWLLDNSGMTLEEIDERRREREWPPVPEAVTPEQARLYASPEYWLTDRARSKAANNPFEAERIERTTPVATGDGVFGGWGRGDEANGDGPAAELQAPAVQPVATPKRPERPKAMVLWKGEEKPHPYGPYQYVPLHHISPWMVKAIMTTEDNSFFEHSGFNWFALKGSIEDNIEAGGFVRGASTVSMQLIKNLFLKFDKVVARKLREAFLVWAMESAIDVPKARIMELYLNVIEFGPGIFGINDAAVHYFGKRPDELDLTEVAWLVSIVPNPKKYHIYYERGEISDAWFRRMLRYVQVMVNRERATEFDLEQAKLDKPAFYKPGDEEPMLRIERPEPVEEKDLLEDLPFPGGLFE